MKQTVKHYFKIFLNLFIALVTLLLIVFVLPKLIVFFAPFLIGWLIANVAHPVVMFIEKHFKIKRRAVIAVVISLAVAGVALLIYGICYMLFQELTGFAQSIPEMFESVKITFSNVTKSLQSLLSKNPFGLKTDVEMYLGAFSEWISEWTSSLGTPTVNALGRVAKNIPGVIVGIIMCLLSAYFFLAEREGLTGYIKKYTPKVIQKEWALIYKSLAGALGGYIKAQFKIEFFMYFIVLIGLLIFQVKYATLIALGIAFLDLLPVFGTGTVLVPWAVIRFFENDYKMAIGLLILWGVGLLFRQIIQPKIVGDSIGLAPLPTLFLIYIGWQFGGVVGMLIAVPIGVLVIKLNEAGIFNNVKDSIKILINDVQSFRKYSDEDKNYHKHYQEDEGQHS